MEQFPKQNACKGFGLKDCFIFTLKNVKKRFKWPVARLYL